MKYITIGSVNSYESAGGDVVGPGLAWPGRKVEIMQCDQRVEKLLEKTGCRLVVAVVAVYSSNITESCPTERRI